MYWIGIFSLLYIFHTSIAKCSDEEFSDEAGFCLDEPASDPLIEDASSRQRQECVMRQFHNASSFVCVCNAKFCDEIEPVGKIEPDQMIIYLSTAENFRLKRFTINFENVKEENFLNDDELCVELIVGSLPDNANDNISTNDNDNDFVGQKIFGFGGAFTDAAGINIASLSAETQRRLLESYYGEIGIGYTIGRVPIASCDFSTREYSYLDENGDFELESFALADEDLKYKIPFIQRAAELSENRLRLFASPWSAPGWMKTNGRMKGGGMLKGEFNGKYYRTYAKYYARFFEKYYKHGIKFWAVTVENEPGFGNDTSYPFQAMFMGPEMQRDFTEKLLGPELRASKASANLKIIGHDDQRSYIFEAAQKIYDPKHNTAIEGLGVHWYSKRTPYETLSQVHNLRPDKFILATEACTGVRGLDKVMGPILGDWSRGVEYAMDILNNLRNWVIGWTDWNLALDMRGGPNWVGNFVDAPIIVNAEKNEFYKQPMYYALGHFSKFITPGSTRINIKANSDMIQQIAFQTPTTSQEQFASNTVVVGINRASKERCVNVRDARAPNRLAVMRLPPNAIFTAIWTIPS